MGELPFAHYDLGGYIVAHLANIRVDCYQFSQKAHCRAVNIRPIAVETYAAYSLYSSKCVGITVCSVIHGAVNRWDVDSEITLHNKHWQILVFTYGISMQQMESTRLSHMQPQPFVLKKTSSITRRLRWVRQNRGPSHKGNRFRTWRIVDSMARFYGYIN